MPRKSRPQRADKPHLLALGLSNDYQDLLIPKYIWLPLQSTFIIQKECLMNTHDTANLDKTHTVHVHTVRAQCVSALICVQVLDSQEAWILGAGSVI